MITEMRDSHGFFEEVALRLSRGERTNFFMAEQEVVQCIGEGRLGRMDIPGGVYFFLEKTDQIELFYFLEKTAVPAPLPTFDRPLIMEEVLLSTKERSPSEQMWMAAGFIPYLERKRLYLLAKNVSDEKRQIAFAKEGMGEEIRNLMDLSFDPFTSALPPVATLEADIARGCVLVAMEGTQLMGFLRFGQIKQDQMLWQVAVAPEARGRGIAKSLVLDWMSLERENTKKFMLWVRLDNPPALKLYDTLGFVPDLRIAPVMIKKKRG